MQNKIDKTIVLIGLMGAGKSSIGKRLSEKLGLEFFDLDKEIEKQENMTVSNIFAAHGEEYFRKKEAELLSTYLDKAPHILATGGGAYIPEKNRSLINKKGIPVWLRADLEVLFTRVSRKDTRPLLEAGDKKEILKKLMDERYPVYETSEIVVDSLEIPHEITLEKIITELKKHGHLT